MKGESHRKVTGKAFEILPGVDRANPLYKSRTAVAREAAEVDNYLDLEFVDVEGLSGSPRDDPHKDEKWPLVADDIPHKTFRGSSLTAFNHFIDIKKGPGLFDDYDGYSYRKGSASRDEYQTMESATRDPAEKLLLAFFSALAPSTEKVDAAINWWFNDEYIHALGQKWYRGCSTSVESYSFPEDRGTYRTKEAELKKRFPLADSVGDRGKGIPYSVFMPVDNMARYWYLSFMVSKSPLELGPVMHAIQDASIPHHAAGYNGNWHARHESDLNSKMDSWLGDPRFAGEVKELFKQWNRMDSSPPNRLAANDWRKVPAANWRMDQLVTWVALNAYREYDRAYNHFRNGYRFNDNSGRELVKIATAMSLLALCKAPERPLPLKEDCLSFNYQRATVRRVGHRWAIVAGNMVLLDFGNKVEANQVLRIIKHYRMNSQCFVGRPDPSMTYYLVDGRTPSGYLRGQDCVSFDPENAKVKRIDGSWRIVDGSHYIKDFGDKHEEAIAALRIIRKYGFRYICFVGRPDPSMTYFRC